MKLWHDDIRLPPDDSWSWARTNDQAIFILDAADRHGITIEEISLDHDLGLEDVNPRTPGADLMIGKGEETGYELACWLCEVRPDLIPRVVTIHSMNPVGAGRMRDKFTSCKSDALKTGIILKVEPYRP